LAFGDGAFERSLVKVSSPRECRNSAKVSPVPGTDLHAPQVG
jgi:hypothetical protein